MQSGQQQHAGTHSHQQQASEPDKAEQVCALSHFPLVVPDPWLADPAAAWVPLTWARVLAMAEAIA